MQQKQHTVLWQQSVALLSLLVLLGFSVATAFHIHNEVPGSLLQQECVLCVIGGQSATLLGHIFIVAAYLLTIFCLFRQAEHRPSTSYRSSGTPRAPPAFS